MRPEARSLSVRDDDLADARLIVEDVVRFAQMDFRAYVAHIESNPQDKFCEVPHPLGTGHLPCSRGGYESFRRLTNYAIDQQRDGLDFDRDAVEREMRSQFSKIFLTQEREIDDASVLEMLSAALEESSMAHEQRTHWFPCVLFHGKKTTQFEVGPVRFFTREVFFAEHAAAFDALREDEKAVTLAAVRDERVRSNLPYKTEAEALDLADSIVRSITDYFAEYDWVAEVSVPSCALTVSEQRAQDAIQGALDVLKMHFGPRAQDIRIAHHRGLRSKTARWRRGEDGAFDYTLHYGGEDIVVQETWWDEVIRPNQFYFRAAGDALAGYTNPLEGGELSLRFRDGLFWYGQAITEKSPSAKIVKYAACIERLTIILDIRHGFTKEVTERVAFLCGGSPTGEKKRLDQAKTVYGMRSELMHGKRSPFSRDLPSVVATAFDLAENCLFSFLHVCWWISEQGLPLTDASLEAFYAKEIGSRRGGALPT